MPSHALILLEKASNKPLEAYQPVRKKKLKMKSKKTKKRMMIKKKMKMERERRSKLFEALCNAGALRKLG